MGLTKVGYVESPSAKEFEVKGDPSSRDFYVQGEPIGKADGTIESMLIAKESFHDK
jgi:hypothetical protein